MEQLKLFSVSDAYIKYLRKKYPNVYSNKIGERNHTRKYIGAVMEINNFKYYVPLSSPKDSDYEIINEEKVIRKSTLTIIRITEIDGVKEELKGTLRISHMIPVLDSELEIYDVDAELDSTYKDLVQKELIFIRKNAKKIITNAKIVYKQKEQNIQKGYIKSSLDFKGLEKMAKQWDNNQDNF